MSRHQEWDVRCKVYVGNLGNNASKTELEAVFSHYGPLKNVWVARYEIDFILLLIHSDELYRIINFVCFRNPPGFAFIEFQDPRGEHDLFSLIVKILKYFDIQMPKIQ
jgi:RNA recognition motif-containing protein